MAKVDRFAYVHLLNAHKMQEIPLVAAKQAFVDRLQGTCTDHPDLVHRSARRTREAEQGDLASILTGSARRDAGRLPFGRTGGRNCSQRVLEHFRAMCEADGAALAQ